MIRKTFCHTQGISQDTEEMLWENGIVSWDDFLEQFNYISCLPQSKLEKIRTEVLFSKDYLDKGDLNYFKERLPSKEHYRLARYGKIAFVDIETTGLSKYTDDITLIGIYDGQNPHIYINGQNLEEAKEKLKEFDIVVTFNGKLFDMPFIEHKFKEKYNILHLDLRFMLKELGLAGGLKNIERICGICRDEDVASVDGFEAVRLWRRYQNGDKDALRLLLKYNEQDIVNLKYLLEYYLQEKAKTMNRYENMLM